MKNSLKKRNSAYFRHLSTFFVFSLVVLATASGLETMTAENGDPYILTIRYPGHPITSGDISTWTQELGGMAASSQHAVGLAASIVDSQNIVAYGYYQDNSGAGHEFEYDVLGDSSGQSYDRMSVQAAADSWIAEVTRSQEIRSVLATSQNEDWPVVATKTRHREMQPYGKLTTVWELRKKAVSSPGKTDFAIRTHSVVEPGVHAWPQSSKWTLDDTQPFLDVTHDWSVCPKNPIMNSFEPASSVTGRAEKNITVQLLPIPAFSYQFIKPELTLVESEISPITTSGVWHMDLYSHSPAKAPDEIIQGIMPGSSVQIDTPVSGVQMPLVTLKEEGHFVYESQTSGFNFDDTVFSWV